MMRPALPRAIMGFMVWALAASFPAQAKESLDPFAGVGIDARPGAVVPQNAVFRDEAGQEVRLGDLLGRRPVILAPVYYRCPNICGATLARLFSSLNDLSLTVGNDFDVVAVSFDQRETPADAAEAEAKARQRYARPDGGGAYFLTGSEASIATLTDAIGFRYRWDPALGQYAHAAALAVLTPSGKIVHWLNSMAYEPIDLRLALVEAGQGRIGDVADQILLLCYQYDPETGRYSSFIWTALRAGSTACLVAIAIFVLLALRREQRARRRSQERST